MHKGVRKVIGITDRNVIFINPETGNIDWTFNDWGLNWNAALEAGGVLESDDVRISYEVQSARQS